jgi:hypothetical protein
MVWQRRRAKPVHMPLFFRAGRKSCELRDDDREFTDAADVSQKN